MADDNTSFTLDLDSSNFVANSKAALNAIQQVGDANNLNGLLGVLESMGPMIAAVAVAVLALKEGWDSVFDAEEIQSINEQFKIFTDLAGVSADKLKEGLSAASGGWVDETNLMKSANKAMIELETGIDKLPQLMGLAKNATMTFGGTVTEQFDNITRSIAAGNQRGLRQAGIIVDVSKAYREFALAHDIVVGALSKAGQQQALLNAVLETGSSKMGKVGNDIKPVTSAWNQFKAAITEARESMEILADKVLGGTFKTAFTWLGDTFKALNVYLKKDMGEGMEGMANKSQYLAARIGVVREKMIEFQKEAKESHDVVARWAAADDLQKLKKEYNALLMESSKLNASIKKGKEAQAQPEKKDVSVVDPVKRAEQEAAAKKELEAINTKIANEEKKNIQTIAQADAAYDKQKTTEVKAIEAQMAEVRAKENAGTLSKSAAEHQLMQLEKLRVLTATKDEKELAAERTKALDNYLEKSKSTFDGIARGFSVMSDKNKLALKDFGSIGSTTASSFSSHMSGAFKSIGDGSKSATAALGGAFEGMVGDMASHYGEMMFLASVWPPNPAGLAAGAALMTLGGLLGGLSSGGSTASSAGSYGGGGSNTGSNSGLAANAQQTMPQKNMTLVINGPMLGNDQTARWLVDQVRNASDATAFTIQSVNGGFGV